MTHPAQQSDVVQLPTAAASRRRLAAAAASRPPNAHGASIVALPLGRQAIFGNFYRDSSF